MFRFLYPHHTDPRTLGLYPWLEVLRDTERGFVCACCGGKQHWFRPMVFMPDSDGYDPASLFCWRIARRWGAFNPWCASCAWKACGRKMVRARRWYEFWR